LPEIAHNDSICAKDYACAEACPKQAISLNRESRPIHINRRLCKSCREYSCVSTCHNRALKVIGKYISVEEIIDEIAQDTLFYRNSNGGVSLSGGEPLHQPVFTLNLLRRCRERGLHTVLDTSGYADWEVLREILEFVDLVLFDVKCFNTKDHLRLTGVSNEKILQNLKSIVSQASTPVVARIPVVPGSNDSPSNITDSAKFFKDIGLKEVNLLPYHKLGIGKYRNLGKRCPLKKVDVPIQEHLDQLKKLIESYGLTCETY
jgi:pyruvate formate lyase activating enzyme